MDKESFIFHREWKDAIAKLPDEMRLEILEAIIEYGTTGQQKEVSQLADAFVYLAKSKIDKDSEKYEVKCNQRKEAIKKRWKKNNDNSVSNSDTKRYEAIRNDTNGYETIRTDTNGYEAIRNDTRNTSRINSYSDNDCDSDSEGDSDNMSSTSIASEEHSNLSSSLHSEDLSFPAVAETDEPEKRFHKNFMDFFNQEIKTAGAVIKPIQIMTDKRKGLLNARLRECGKQKLAIAIQKAARSDFLNGKNERAFIATFDWIIKPNNFPKVLEGNYDNDRFKNTGYDNTTVRQSSAAMEKAERDAEFADYIAGKLRDSSVQGEIQDG